MIALKTFLLITLFVVSSGCRPAAPLPSEPVPVGATTETAFESETPADLVTVTIRTDAGDHVFAVETAISADEQRRGLMFRESLPENGGMLFPFDRQRIASFWMRNTMIPLDIIFIAADGRIANIARETVPYSLDSSQSVEPVVAVLELNGGRSAALDINAGDHVSWPDGPILPE
jgi:uncharacterized membrane protein (UPF0127 family)